MEMRFETGDNVMPFRRESGNGNFPALAQVEAYWEGLRRGRLMPERQEVDPRGIEGALEYAFMLEQIAPGVARIRVAGMHLNDLLGMEVRGMPFTAFFDPANRNQLSKTLENVLNTPQIANLALSSDREIGRPDIKAQLFLAPLSNGNQGLPRILGCLQSHGQIGRTPRRFQIQQINHRVLGSASTNSAQQDLYLAKAPEKEPEITGFAGPGAEFQHKETTPQEAVAVKQPFLRLVKTDE